MTPGRTMTAGATLIGVALARLVIVRAGWPDPSPGLVLAVGAGFLLAGKAWALWAAWEHRRALEAALDAHGPGAVLEPVRLREAARPGDVIGADGRRVSPDNVSAVDWTLPEPDGFTTWTCLGGDFSLHVIDGAARAYSDLFAGAHFDKHTPVPPQDKCRVYRWYANGVRYIVVGPRAPIGGISYPDLSTALLEAAKLNGER